MAILPIDWDEYRLAVLPFEAAVQLLRDGDRAGLAVAVDYLVGQPRFFGSGYLFEEVASAVAVGPDAGDLAAEIRAVVLDGARLPIRRETRYVARLAARYWSDALEAELMSIQRGAARWILKRAKEVRQSYIALGLVST